MRIYFDNCSYNRPFDDQTQIKLLKKNISGIKIVNLMDFILEMGENDEN
jgi:hypothetical protein